MNASRSWGERGIGAAGAALVGALAMGNAGCAAPEPIEAKRATTAKLMAPDPTLCADASDQTVADLGIAKWCAYRGRGGVYLTGYSSKGHAVKGLAVEFTRQPDGQLAELHLNVNDGTHFAVHHTLRSDKITTTNALQTGSQALVNAATRDLGMLHAAIRQRARVVGLTALPPTNACASNLLGSILTPFMGAGMSQAAALSLLAQTGTFANASGASCIGFIGSGANGVSGLPFNGNLAQINPATICGSDPVCLAEFGMFSRVGSPAGFSFAPNPAVTGFVGVPGINGNPTFASASSFLGNGGLVGFPTDLYQAIPPSGAYFNSVGDSVGGAPSTRLAPGPGLYGFGPNQAPMPDPNQGVPSLGDPPQDAFGYLPQSTSTPAGGAPSPDLGDPPQDAFGSLPPTPTSDPNAGAIGNPAGDYVPGMATPSTPTDGAGSGYLGEPPVDAFGSMPPPDPTPSIETAPGVGDVPTSFPSMASSENTGEADFA